MSLNQILGILFVLVAIGAAIFVVSDLVPRWRVKKRHDRHLDQLFQFDHLRADSDSNPDDKK